MRPRMTAKDDPGELLRLAHWRAPGVATFVVDHALRYVAVEGQALQEAALTSEDFVGRTIDEVNRESAGPICADFTAALAGSTFQREHTVAGRRFLTRGGPVVDDHGCVLGAVATSVDITDKWRGEQLSRAQEETLGEIAAGLPAERCIETLGRRAAMLSPGLRVAALIADAQRQTFERVISPQLGPRFTSALVGAPIGPEPVGTCGWAVHHGRVIDCPDVDGDSLWSPPWRELCHSLGIRAVRSYPVVDARGVAMASFMMALAQPGGPDPFESMLARFACNALRLLLEREAAQRATIALASQSARHFERLADAGPAMIWTIDAAGMATYASRAWYEYTGMQPGEALGVGWLDAVHPADRDRVYEFVATRLQRGENVRLEYRMRYRGDGRYRWVLADVRAHRDEQGRPDGHIGTVADIDDVRRAHELLSREDRRKDEFLATLAHELRNPLAPIGNGLALMKRTAQGHGDAQRTLAMMERQFRQLTRLVDDLLDTSRIKSGRLQLKIEPVDLASVIGLAVDSVCQKLEARGQHLAVEMATESLVLSGDGARLAQVVSNLLDNACKYTPDEGQLRLSVTTESGQVRIEVADNGDGISLEFQPGVFDIFDRADQTLGHKTDGLGVGLYLVRSLVALHGGDVQLHSAGVGRGTTVVVTLPQRASGQAVGADPAGRPSQSDESDAGASEAAHAAEPGRTRPVRVLVADDNHDAGDSLALLLQELDCQVVVARDGHAALEAAQASPFDLAVLDIGMPDMDGYELARRLRAHWRAEHEVTLVALTGWGQAADRLTAQEAGFHQHWVKPVSLETIEALLRTLRR